MKHISFLLTLSFLVACSSQKNSQQTPVEDKLTFLSKDLAQRMTQKQIFDSLQCYLSDSFMLVLKQKDRLLTPSGTVRVIPLKDTIYFPKGKQCRIKAIDQSGRLGVLFEAGGKFIPFGFATGVAGLIPAPGSVITYDSAIYVLSYRGALPRLKVDFDKADDLTNSREVDGYSIDEDAPYVWGTQSQQQAPSPVQQQNQSQQGNPPAQNNQIDWGIPH